jgi:hypothetical protein
MKYISENIEKHFKQNLGNKLYIIQIPRYLCIIGDIINLKNFTFLLFGKLTLSASLWEQNQNILFKGF